jgi:hypothetical protein
MLRYSTIIAALILAGSAVTASAASKTAHHRYHGLYMQTPSSTYTSAPQTFAPNRPDDYITDHAKGAVKDD